MTMSLKPVLQQSKGWHPLRLKSERLQVDISGPGVEYSGSRFDWSAFITQVTLDGRHTFCVPEATDGTGTGGDGLCSEFGILGVPGFDDASVGEQFVKPGVGLLTKPDDRPYSFSRDYAMEPFERSVETHDTYVRFITEPMDCRGIALRCERQLRINDNHLYMDCRMENVGSRAVKFDEYCHNFVAFNGRSVGPDTTLCWSRAARPDRVAHGMHYDAQGVKWITEPNQTFYNSFQLSAAELPQLKRDFWELRHVPSGVWMRETTSQPWSRFALFGNERLVSPEAFLLIDLQPGAVQSWTRHFEFHAPRISGSH